MTQPEWIEINQADFITIDTIGPPGERTFYLQATQDELVISIIIEKEQAAALAIAISSALDQVSEPFQEPDISTMGLLHPVDPIFRAGKLEMGYNPDRNVFVISVEELALEEEPKRQVHIWGTPTQMLALSRKAAEVVAAGRPLCPLCGEVVEPDEEHVCVRDNGRKRLYSLDQS